MNAQTQQQPLELYLLTAAWLPAILVGAYLAIAAVPRCLGTSWARLFPSWLTILSEDIVSVDDIRHLDQEEEKAEKIRQSQLTPDERRALESHNPTPPSAVAAAEETPLLRPASSSPRKTAQAAAATQLWHAVALAAIATLQLLGWVAALTYHLEQRGSPATDDSRRDFAAVASIQFVAWLYALFRPLTRRKTTPAYDLLVLYSIQVIAAVVGVHDTWLQGDRSWSHVLLGVGLAHVASAALSAVALTIIFSTPISEVEYAVAPPDALGRPPAAEDQCTLWQWTTFSWVSPLIATALTRTLEKTDVWSLSKTCRSSLLLRKFKEVRANSLPWRILRSNGHDMLLDLILTLVSSVLSYATPFFLKRILDAIQQSSHPHGTPGGDAAPTSKSTAYLYAVFSLLAMIVKSQADLQHLFYGRRACIRIRGQLIASIYEKALRTRDMTGVLSSETKPDADATGSQATPPPPSPDKKAAAKASKGPAKAEATNDASIGRVVSLAAVDAIRIAAEAAAAYMLYSAPIEFIIASLFLYRLLGLSAFSGFLVLLVASPLQTRLTRQMVKISKELSAARDKRLGAVNEMTQNLKFVKYYAFEEEMKRRILDLRRQELAWLRKRQISQTLIQALWTLTPAAVTTVSFASYVLIAKKDLDVATAFTSIALFQLLKGPLNALPMHINDLLNVKVASDRIQEFLNADEVDGHVSSLNDNSDRPLPTLSPEKFFGCENATFKWPVAPVSNLANQKVPSAGSNLKKVMSRFFKRRLEEDERAAEPLLAPSPRHEADNTSQLSEASQPFQLSDITFLPPAGHLSLVIGPTGSGKSALLTALLGEMEQVSGLSHLYKSNRIDPKTGLRNTIAYCAQSPWLQHASIRANILFGQPFESERYETVLDICALRPDLEILDGDSTEIGEKGVSLSGGQQARVALARAVYSRASILLLDDPLSAVDTHTAAKLVKECLCGPLMKGRTVVLVTHHAELILGGFAPAWVVKMSEGQIEAQGTPQQLMQLGELEEPHRDGNALDEQPQQQQRSAESIADETEGQGKKAVANGSSGADAGEHAPAKPRKLVEEEARARGGVKKEVYKMYLDALGWAIAGMVLLALIAFKGTDLAEKGWLAVWGASYSAEEESLGVTTMALRNVSHHHQHGHVEKLSSDYMWAANAFTPSTFLAHPQHVDNVAFRAADAPSFLPPADKSPLPYILIFFGIQVAAAATVTASALLTYYGSLNASRTLFSRMLASTMGATTRWLDKTPTGRIVNKFSRDVEVLDSNINNSLRYFVTFVISGVIAVLTIIFVLPSFLLPTLILGSMNYYVARGYIRAARDLRRLESVSRSPIFSAFSELLQGISTVRAFGAEKRMLKECTDRIDLANSFFLYFWMTNRWLLFRLDILGAVAIFLATVGALYGQVPAGLAGLALTQSQGIIQAMFWMSRFYTNLEQDANSIERIREALDEVPQEPASIVEDNRPPAHWPSRGKVEVKDLVLRYAPDLPPVLHGISFTIQPGEKVGIVGRTGSGKSTTALAFFRFVEFDSGTILIDGVDIAKIGLYDLRSRMTIIPQNAVLFSGTIRDNLDPFHNHTDDECLAALHAVHIRTTPPSAMHSRPGSRPTSRPASPHREPEQARRHATRPLSSLVVPGEGGEPSSAVTEAAASAGAGAASGSQTYVTLDTRVSEGGGNFSQGQRQLLAMARALLRGTQIILMDEASSAVDFRTDALIQSTIRHGFKGATVITIAHRLHTVAYADKVLVLDAGRVKEFGSPEELMQDEDSVFHSMCQKSGDFASLKNAAREAQAERERERKGQQQQQQRGRKV